MKETTMQQQTNIAFEKMTGTEVLQYMMQRLHDAGLKGTFEVAYCGSGDSGSVEEPDLSEMPEVAGAIEGMNFCWDYGNDTGVGLLGIIDDILPGGWEINEGSSGRIVFDIAANTVTIDHDENVMSTENHTYELW